MNPIASNTATAVPGLGPSSNDAAGSSALGKDEFVKLLMTQLANQDPTNPQDSEAFVAQLAQFANVELQQTANANLEAILVAQAANNQVSTAALVGKEVVYKTDEVYIDDATNPTISAKLAGNAQRMVVNLTDESGRTLTRTVEGPFRAGNIDLKVSDVFSDLDLPPGAYKMEVTAANTEGKSVDVSTRVRATITGVTFENGYAQLLIGNLRVSLNDVEEILSPDAPTYVSNDDRQADGAFTATNPTAPDVNTASSLPANLDAARYKELQLALAKNARTLRANPASLLQTYQKLP